MVAMVTDIPKHSYSFATKLHVAGEVCWRVAPLAGKCDDNFVLKGAVFFPNDEMGVGTLYYNLQ